MHTTWKKGPKYLSKWSKQNLLYNLWIELREIVQSMSMSVYADDTYLFISLVLQKQNSNSAFFVMKQSC